LPWGLRQKFYLYWMVVITFGLPFSFGAMLILNASYTPNSESVSPIWVYQYLVALFFFVSLVHHGPLATILWVLASILAFAPVFFLEKVNWEAIEQTVLLPFPVYLTAVIIGSLTNRNVSMVQTEKLRAASAIGANLAHELRTPLASIGVMSKGASNLLPVLTDAYEKAKQAGIPVAPLRRSQIQALNNALLSIRNEVEYSNTIIDMLLLNTADKPLANVQTDIVHASEIVSEAARRFPFNNQKERDLVSVDIRNDFVFDSPRLLLVHVLFNLIKNALYFVQKSGHGEIQLYTDMAGTNGLIVVHDTGAGIPNSVLPHIFERFYTTTPTGQSAGIGLSFCKLVMDSIGARIACESKEGEFTTITLTFPGVTDEKPAPHSAPAPDTPKAGFQKP
ncbi:MAG: sensor histidine kinase, partial [Pseudomonadales bacterium]